MRLSEIHGALMSQPDGVPPLVALLLLRPLGFNPRDDAGNPIDLRENAERALCGPRAAKPALTQNRKAPKVPARPNGTRCYRTR